jgi:thiamine biosynthesis protein ThiC
MKNDEVVGNYKKKYTLAVVFLIIVALIAIGSEVFTTKYVGDQKTKINRSITNSKRISQMQSEIENLIAFTSQELEGFHF